MILKDYFECCNCDAAWEMDHCPPNAPKVYHNQPMCPVCKSKYVKWENYEVLRKQNFR